MFIITDIGSFSKWWKVLLVIVVIGLGLWWFLRSEENESFSVLVEEENTAFYEPAVDEVIPTPTEEPLREVSVYFENNEMVPDVIELDEYELIRLVLEARDGDYMLEIDDWEFAMSLDEGEIVRERLIISEKGEYSLECGQGCFGLVRVN